MLRSISATASPPPISAIVVLSARCPSSGTGVGNEDRHGGSNRAARTQAPERTRVGAVVEEDARVSALASLLLLGVIGGQPGGPEFVVPLLGRDGGVQCTAVLLGAHTAITAAHCVDDVSALDVSGAAVEVLTATAHPRWVGGADFDLALLSTGAHQVTSRLGSARPALAVGAAEGRRATLGASVRSESVTTWTLETDGGFACGGDSGGAVLAADGDVVALISRGDAQCAGDVVVTKLDLDWLRRAAVRFDGASCEVDGACATSCPAPDPDCACAADDACSASCADVDPDCARDCGADGVCSTGPCARRDVDCVDEFDTCDSALRCEHRRCASLDGDAPPVCTQTCAVDEDCGTGASCGPRAVCQLGEREAPTPSGCAVSGEALLWLAALLLRLRTRKRRCDV